MVDELLKHLGFFATPVIYAAAAYGFFHWLDKNASAEAKVALAQTMRLKDYKSEQVASALVEIFDRIYTYPLLRWRAFLRSLLFTTVVTAIWAFESNYIAYTLWGGAERSSLIAQMVFVWLFNGVTDYLSLFVIRRVLIRSGTKPVISLTLGAVSGLAIVLVANSLRDMLILFIQTVPDRPSLREVLAEVFSSPAMLDPFTPSSFGFPAFMVFAWLPLFALGIMVARLLTLLSWIVGRAQWALKEGNEHPLKAIGYVAAIVVFLGTVAARAAFNA